MRTSRISRDTSRIIAASRTQRTLRQTRTATTLAAHDIDNSNGAESTADPTSESELSSAPAWSESDGDAQSTTGKRKRGQQTAAVVPAKRERKKVPIAPATSPKEEATTPKKKAHRPPAKKSGKTEDGEEPVKVEPPPNWEEMYALTREMRNENLAPVDTMGCESLAETHRSPRDRRFQTLIALMLSSQTKDTVNAVAMRNMQEGIPGGLTLESILALPPTTLNTFINKVGFHNLKTDYIKRTAQILRDTHNSDIPATLAGLVALPGVGPKMAYLTLSAAWGRDEGIGVDVHVHRITNLWGWHATRTPEQTRVALEKWLPRDKWHDVNNLLVGFGQTVCLPVGRRCGVCKLAGRGLCPSVVEGGGAAAAEKKRKKVRVKVEEAVGEGGGVLGESGGERMEGRGDGVVKVEVKEEEEEVEAAIPDMEDIGIKLRTTRTRPVKKRR